MPSICTPDSGPWGRGDPGSHFVRPGKDAARHFAAIEFDQLTPFARHPQNDGVAGEATAPKAHGPPIGFIYQLSILKAHGVPGGHLRTVDDVVACQDYFGPRIAPRAEREI